MVESKEYKTDDGLVAIIHPGYVGQNGNGDIVWTEDLVNQFRQTRCFDSYLEFINPSEFDPTPVLADLFEVSRDLWEPKFCQFSSLRIFNSVVNCEVALPEGLSIEWHYNNLTNHAWNEITGFENGDSYVIDVSGLNPDNKSDARRYHPYFGFKSRVPFQKHAESYDGLDYTEVVKLSDPSSVIKTDKSEGEVRTRILPRERSVISLFQSVLQENKHLRYKKAG